MSNAGLAVFDQTIQETNTWLRHIERHLNGASRQVAYHALRGVLFALRDRLPVEIANNLAAQFPLLVRGLFFEGYHAAGKPEKLHRDAFLARVETELEHGGGSNAVAAADAVFRVLNERLSPGTAARVRRVLPRDLRTLWPEPTTCTSP